MPKEMLVPVSGNATGLWGVAGKGRDRDEVEAVLEPLPIPPPVPVPSPLELDPELLRNSARVGVIPSSSEVGTRALSSLGL